MGKVEFVDKDNVILETVDISLNKDITRSTLLEYLQYTFLKYISANV